MSVSAAASHCKYPGFISYSHRDKAFADRLHRAIERYRVPARLVGGAGAHGPVPKRLYPIFRDRDELAAGSLGAQLHEAIAQSRCFVLICSPAAAQSRWVNEEVAHFLKVGDPSRLLCLIVDGEPNAADPARECFPPAIREAGLEPMAAMSHGDADGEANARLKIIAGLLGVGFEELRRRDLAARNRRLVAIAATSLGVAALTLVLAIQALRARDEAERSRQQGEELIGFMLGELRGKLEPLGKLDILDAVGDKAMAYFAGLDAGRDPGPGALAGRAKALRQIGEVRFAQGRPADALETLGVALALQRDLAARRPEDLEALFELGQTEFWVGYAASRSGHYDRAEQNFLAYRDVSEQLVARQPEALRWQVERAYARTNLGTLAYERRRYAEAQQRFEAAAAAARPLIALSSLDAAVRAEMAGVLSWLGLSLSDGGSRDQALPIFEEYATRMRALIAAHPDDRRLQASMADSLSSFGFALIEAGQPQRALAIAEEGLRLADALVASDPANLNYVRHRAYYLLVVAGARHPPGPPPPAAKVAVDVAYRALMDSLARDPSHILVRVSLASTWDLAFPLALQDRDPFAARRLVAEAVAIADGAPDDSPYTAQIRATAHLMALELALFRDHDEAAVTRERDAVTAALAMVDRGLAANTRRIDRLRAMLALMSGLDHIPDTVQPDTAAPWAYSAVWFVDRRCASGSTVAASWTKACEGFSARRVEPLPESLPSSSSARH